MRGVDLICDALPFGCLWYAGPNAVSNAIGYGKHYSRSHDSIGTWVDGLKATKIWWNGDSKAWEDSGLPDHEVRRRNALHIVEYTIGKPIDRSMEVSGSYQELSKLIDDPKASPEAQRLLGAGFFDQLLSEQSKAEGKDQEKPHERLRVLPEQETG